MNSISTSHYDQIADGLADNGYACVDGFLTSAEVSAILEADDFKDALLHFRKAGIGQDKRIREGIRGDYIQWIDRSAPPAGLKTFLDRMSGLMTHVNRSLFLSIRDYDVHKTIYPAGAYYKKHLDQLKSTDHRKLSVICYLNNDWKDEHGGQLRMHLPEEKDFFPIAGRLICFRSDLIEHEVLPATRSRLSLTGWFLDRAMELINP